MWSDLSIAETAWGTLSSMYRGVIHVKNQTQNQGKDAIFPVVSPQCSARALVHSYVTSIHISSGAHTVDLFDEHDRCLVSYIIRVPVPSTKQEANL